jgi:hypothetical protein
MTDANRAAHAMTAVAATTKHCDDTFSELAAAVVTPLSTSRRETTDGDVYDFEDGSRLYVARKVVATLAAEEMMDKALAARRAYRG